MSISTAPIPADLPVSAAMFADGRGLTGGGAFAGSGAFAEDREFAGSGAFAEDRVFAEDRAFAHGEQPRPVPDVSMVATLLGDAFDDGLEQPCRTEDPELWFAEAPEKLEQAKRLCQACPVRRACLAAALARRERWGVWGGEIFHRGVVLAVKRPRGRPRKVKAG